MVYFLRRIKDVHLLFASKREEDRKILNIKKDSEETLVFVLSQDFCQKKKKIKFIIVNFQTQFIDNKIKLWGENYGKLII